MKTMWIRSFVLVAAVGAAIWAVASNWDEVRAAFGQMPLWVMLFSLFLSFAYVACTMLSWRAIIGVGSPVNPAVASRIFYSSQVAKYLPGGVWNFVAAAEVGRDYLISRRKSVTSLLVSVAISIMTGLILTLVGLAFASSGVLGYYRWIFIAIPLGGALLMPPVLNPLVNAALRIVRREPLESPITWEATIKAAAWATLAWLVVGSQLFVMLTALGMEATPATFARAVGGYALGWTAGFLVVIVPAGVGVREAALAAALTGTVPQGALVVVVLLSRVMTIIADVVLGVLASLKMRNEGKAQPFSEEV